jgi:hypothetical protein
MFREIVIVILDKNAGFQEVALEQALATGMERAFAEDKALASSANVFHFALSSCLIHPMRMIAISWRRRLEPLPSLSGLPTIKIKLCGCDAFSCTGRSGPSG